MYSSSVWLPLQRQLEWEIHSTSRRKSDRSQRGRSTKKFSSTSASQETKGQCAGWAADRRVGLNAAQAGLSSRLYLPVSDRICASPTRKSLVRFSPSFLLKTKMKPCASRTGRSMVSQQASGRPTFAEQS